MLVRKDLLNKLIDLANISVEYLNAKDEDIKWITVKGNHIPIKKGQSQDDAVKAFLSKVESKGNKKVANKTQTKRKQLHYINKENAIKQISEDLNINKEQAEEIQDGIDYYTSNGYNKVRDKDATFDKAILARKNIEKYIENAPKYDGKIYRGIQLREEQKGYLNNLQIGSKIDMGGISSWSSSYSVGEKFSQYKNRPYSIIFESENKNGVGIEHLSLSHGFGENEVLQSEKAQFKIKSITNKKIRNSYEPTEFIEVYNVILEEI